MVPAGSCGGAQQAEPAGLVEGVGVALDGVDLPGLVAGAGDPDLVLDGVAAGGVLLGAGRQPVGGEPGGGGGDLGGGLDLDAEVVHAGGLAGGALDEDELERRLRDREVGVAGAALGGLGAEQLGVEGDGAFEVGDAERELDAGHGGSSLRGPAARRCLEISLISFPVSLRSCRKMCQIKDMSNQEPGAGAGTAGRTRPGWSAARRWRASRCRRAGRGSWRCCSRRWPIRCGCGCCR